MLSLSNCLVQKFSFIGLVWYDFNEPKKTRFYRALISLIFDLFVSYEFHCVDLAVCGLTKIAKEHGKVEELMVGIVDDIITNL